MAKSTKVIQAFTDLPVGKPVEITALINPESRGARWLKDERKQTWEVTVLLVAWQVGDGPVVQGGMGIRATLDKQASATLVRQTPKGRTIRFTGKRPRSLGSYKPFVRLVGSIEKSPQKLTIERSKKKPARRNVTDKIFGRLKFDRKLDAYICEMTYRDQAIPMEFEATDLAQLESMLGIAKDLWKQRSQWFRRWRDQAFEHYTERLAEAWWQEDQKLTRTLFNKHLGWPCGLSFRLEDGVVHYELTGLSEVLYGDHGIDGCGTSVNDMVINFA